MSYPAYDPDRDSLVVLADHLLGSAALVSFMIGELSGDEFSELAAHDQRAVHGAARMAICDFLTELGARHPAADIATATAILEDAMRAIAENIFPEDAHGFVCEARGHLRRYRPSRR